MIVELLGYLASVLVAISLTMGNVWRLRWINLGGAVAFVAYAWLIASWPVLVVNLWIAGVNVFYLTRMARDRESFDVLEVDWHDPVVQRFVETYADDIRTFFSDVTALEEILEQNRGSCLLILRDLVPVGLVVYEMRDEQTVDVHVDYVTPAYRDFQNGRLLYGEARSAFRERGVRHVRARAEVAEHADYLERMGFEADPEDPTLYRKTL